MYEIASSFRGQFFERENNAEKEKSRRGERVASTPSMQASHYFPPQDGGACIKATMNNYREWLKGKQTIKAARIDGQVACLTNIQSSTEPTAAKWKL